MQPVKSHRLLAWGSPPMDGINYLAILWLSKGELVVRKPNGRFKMSVLESFVKTEEKEQIAYGLKGCDCARTETEQAKKEVTQKEEEARLAAENKALMEGQDLASDVFGLKGRNGRIVIHEDRREKDGFYMTYEFEHPIDPNMVVSFPPKNMSAEQQKAVDCMVKSIKEMIEKNKAMPQVELFGAAEKTEKGLEFPPIGAHVHDIIWVPVDTTRRIPTFYEHDVTATFDKKGKYDGRPGCYEYGAAGGGRGVVPEIEDKETHCFQYLSSQKDEDTGNYIMKDFLHRKCEK